MCVDPVLAYNLNIIMYMRVDTCKKYTNTVEALALGVRFVLLIL